MKYRRVMSDVRWAFRLSVHETENDIDQGQFKRLCDHCQVIDGPKCPRKQQLQDQYQSMTATACIYFHPTNS